MGALCPPTPCKTRLRGYCIRLRGAVCLMFHSRPVSVSRGFFHRLAYQQVMIWNEMKRKFWYGICKMPEWNKMEDFKNGIKNNLPYFHTNFILEFVLGIYKKYKRIVINVILTEMFNIYSIISIIDFVKKSRYFSCVNCVKNVFVRIAS